VENEIRQQISNDWELDLPENLSKKEILEALEFRISELLKGNGEQFFQLMYRLDISEEKVNLALQNNEAVHKLADLIFERQVDKVNLRKTFKKEKDIDKDLEW
jgi:hypothetical protein